MKKMISIAILFMMVSVTCFADFFISPTIGFSNIMTKGETTYSGIMTMYGVSQSISIKSKGKVSWTSFTFGLDMGYIGNKGFTFMFNNHLSTKGNIKYTVEQTAEFKKAGIETAEAKKLGGIVWNGTFIIGYTYRGVPNLFITVGSGLSGTAGKISTKKLYMGSKTREYDEKQYTLVWNAGVPIHFGVHYYFTDLIGINFAFVDTLGYGGYINEAQLKAYTKDDRLYVKGFSNSFTLKIGPSFKF